MPAAAQVLSQLATFAKGRKRTGLGPGDAFGEPALIAGARGPRP
jgi:hypothetical protein